MTGKRLLDILKGTYDEILEKGDDCPAQKRLGNKMYCNMPESDWNCEYAGETFIYFPTNGKERCNKWCKYRANTDDKD